MDSGDATLAQRRHHCFGTAHREGGVRLLIALLVGAAETADLGVARRREIRRLVERSRIGVGDLRAADGEIDLVTAWGSLRRIRVVGRRLCRAAERRVLWLVRMRPYRCETCGTRRWRKTN